MRRGEKEKRTFTRYTNNAGIMFFFSFLPCTLPQVTYFRYHRLEIQKKTQSVHIMIIGKGEPSNR